MKQFTNFSLIAVGALFFPVFTRATLPASGRCKLYIFAPFTFRNESFNSVWWGYRNNLGLSHSAAALMAVDHFNARNATVVDALDQLRDCPVQFDASVFDSAVYTHEAATALLENEVPCAVAGPFHDEPALQLSTLSAALKFPVTAHRSFSIRTLVEYASPYTSQVFPDLITMAQILAEYLLHIGRTDYIAFVYSLTETGLQRQETVSIILDEYGIKNRAFSYNSPLGSPATSDLRTMEKTFQAVRESGYRTIVVASEYPSDEIPLFAHVATNMGLANGDYLWVWFGDFNLLYGYDDPVVREFLKGSIWMPPFEGYHIFLEEDKFARAWHSQGPSEVERLKRVSPALGEPGYFPVEDDYFKKKVAEGGIEYGSAFMYDAVMATGIGACLAMEASKTDSSKNATVDIPVESFVQGIRSVNFTGATGVIRFCNPDYCNLRGARDPATIIWGVLNMYPPGIEDSPFDLTEILFVPPVSSDFLFPNNSFLFGILPRPEANEPFDGFLFIQDTVYADGRTVPPKLLRDPPDQNHVDNGIQALGFTLVGIAIFLAVASAGWVIRHRNHPVLRAAQPHFLYAICLGAGVSVSAILTLSFDESDGWSRSQLSSACMATAWLACLGHIITYGALFSKLWRINRVLQFVRRRVDIFHVAWPSAILVAGAIVVLALWNGLDPLEWHRYEINTTTGESIGECKSDNAAAFIVPLAVVVMIPTLLVFYMAWKTKDVDDTFSESRWIFMMILIQLEVLLFAVPLIPLLRDVSTDARYIGYSILIWTFPISAMGLIIGPRVYVFYRGDTPRGRTRGARLGQVHVSGMQSPSQSSQVRRSTQGSCTDEGTQTDPCELEDHREEQSKNE